MKKNIFIFIFVIFFNMINSQKYLGVNGHPVTQQVYKELDVVKQFDIIKKNFNIYRFDLVLNQDGSIYNSDLYKELLEKSKAFNIQLLPVLILNNEDIKTGNFYNSGREAASLFLKKYPFNYKFIQVGNEEENKIMFGNGTLTGEDISHYDLSTKNISKLEYIKGVCDVLNENNISTIINISYIHYGFIKILKKYNINFDIVGLNWYSDMGNLFAFGENKRNILDEIYSLTKKKIIITEFNVRRGLDGTGNKSWLNSNLSFVKKHKQTLGLIWYELLDESNMILEEQNYGLYKKIGNNWVLKKNAQEALKIKY